MYKAVHTLRTDLKSPIFSHIADFKDMQKQDVKAMTEL